MEKEGFDSYRGKLWSTAINKAFGAPFPEVALQHLLMRIHQKARIEAFEELLSMKWVAQNEREAILDTNIGVFRAEDALSEPVNVRDRNLIFVKALDIERLISQEKENLARRPL